MTTGAAILKEIANTNIKIYKFRSDGVINKDYDMGRITIDLPINKAYILFKKIKYYEKPEMKQQRK